MIFKVGKVLTFFPKTSVVIVKLNSDISSSDSLIFSDLENNRFGQKGSIIQKETEKVLYAKSGSIVSIHVNSAVMKGSYVYKNV